MTIVAAMLHVINLDIVQSSFYHVKKVPPTWVLTLGKPPGFQLVAYPQAIFYFKHRHQLIFSVEGEPFPRSTLLSS